MFLGGNNVCDAPANAHSLAFKQLAPERRPQYVAYPPPDMPEVAKYTSKCCTQRAWARGDKNVVFLGQVPRLLPLQYIPWALDLLLENYGARWVLQTQPNGCAKAWVDDPAHCRTLIDRSKHMLFDVCGVWVARTPAQVEAMRAYQAALQTGGPLDGRVPKHGMVAEGLRPPQSVAMTTCHHAPGFSRLDGCSVEAVAEEIEVLRSRREAAMERLEHAPASPDDDDTTVGECDHAIQRLTAVLDDAWTAAESEQARLFDETYGQTSAEASDS